MWEHWNEALHQSPKNWQNIIKSLVNNIIRHFYELGGSNLPCNAMRLMALLLEAQLSQQLNTKTLLVKSVEAAILCKARHNYGAMAGEQCLMHQFLGLE